MLAILGFIMIYSTTHFFFIQEKAYKNRTPYQKVVTWVAISLTIFLYLGLMTS